MNRWWCIALVAALGATISEAESATKPDCACGNPEASFIRSQMPGTFPYLQGSHHYKKGFLMTAFEEWQAAAKWGDKRSQMLLGLMYFEGQGVEKDWASAHAWMTLAASRGASSAVSDKNRLWAVMSPEEKERAASTFEQLADTYGDEVVADRLYTWYRREFRGPTPNLVLAPGTTGVPVINFDKKLEEAFFGEAFPEYDVLYRDFRTIEPPPNSE